MVDLRTLLHDAAPEPRRALDLDDIRQRARSHGRRRIATWLSGLGLLAGVMVPVGGAVLQPGADSDTTLAIRPAPTPVDATVTTVGVAGASTADVVDARVAASPRKTPLPGVSEGHAQSTAGDATVASASAADGLPVDAEVPGFPRAAECFVDNAGLGPSEKRTCRFQAIRRGGASMHAEPSTASTAGVEATVRVTHDGTTTAYRIGQNSVDAGDFRAFVGCQFVIESGDLVEVELVNAPAATNGTTTLGAGEGWGC